MIACIVHYAFGSWEWFNILAGQTALVKNYSLFLTECDLQTQHGGWQVWVEFGGKDSRTCLCNVTIGWG